MRTDKAQAIQLRHNGKSYKQISRELGVPLSTLAGWLKNESWSQDIKNHLSQEVSLTNPSKLRLMVSANRERWKIKHEEYRTAAIRDFENLKDNPIFLAGIMIYWGEGEKQPKSSQVRLTNNDPEMIRVFNLFLTKILKISSEKTSARLLLYPDLIDSVQKNFWSKTTGLSPSQFKKSAYIKGRKAANRLSYGVCTISVSNRDLKERMLKWLELYKDFLRSYALKLEK